MDFIRDLWSFVVEYRYVTVPVFLVVWTAMIVTTLRGEK